MGLFEKEIVIVATAFSFVPDTDRVLILALCPTDHSLVFEQRGDCPRRRRSKLRCEAHIFVLGQAHDDGRCVLGDLPISQSNIQTVTPRQCWRLAEPRNNARDTSTRCRITGLNE